VAYTIGDSPGESIGALPFSWAMPAAAFCERSSQAPGRPFTAVLLAPTSSPDLPSTVELIDSTNQIRGVRLKPQYPTGLSGTLEFNGETSGTPSGWTKVGSPTCEVGTERNNVVTVRGTVGSGYANRFTLHQNSLTGTCDVFGGIDLTYVAAGDSYQYIGLLLGDFTDTSKVVSVQYRLGSGPAHAGYLAGTENETYGGLNSAGESPRYRIWYRIKREASNVFTTYYSRGLRPSSWTQINTGTCATVPSTFSLGWLWHTNSSSSYGIFQATPIRSYAPFATVGPEVVSTYDSGWDDAKWNPATFAPAHNVAGNYAGLYDFATILPTSSYLYRVAASNGTPALSGSYLTLAQVQALSTLTGRYFKLGVTLPSDGLQQASWYSASIQCTPCPPAVKVISLVDGTLTEGSVYLNPDSKVDAIGVG
jgi:hypothetical protein